MNTPGIKTYVFTYFGLLGLLLANTLIAFLNLGSFSTVIEIGIAIIMALLVAGILMHGFFDAKLIPIIMSAAIIWFLFMLSNVIGDYSTRGWIPFHAR
jgi:cytochrome c oxidase subunit IV